MADLFGEGSSIADILRETANNVLHASVPPGFEYIEEYGQYYNKDTKYFYDPNTLLYYNSETLTYYRYNDATRDYDVVACYQTVKWTSKEVRKRAKKALGEEFKKLNQDSVDICERLLQLTLDVSNAEKKPEDASHSVKKVEALNPLTLSAADIRQMLDRKRAQIAEMRRAPNVQSRQVFDETTGDFHEAPCFSGNQTSNVPEANVKRWEEEENSESDDDDDEDYDNRVRQMQEEGFDEAPLLRIIDSTRRLHVVTMCGGFVGSDNTCEVVLLNSSLPSNCVEVCYCDKVCGYTATKLSDECSVQLNSAVVQTGVSVDLAHGDVLSVSGERLNIHVHFGSNTCTSCEPGLLVSEEPQTKSEVRHIRAEVARRKTMKKLMKSYGITPDESLNAPITRTRKLESVTFPAHMRPNDMYGTCLAKPVADSQRRFPVPLQTVAAAPVVAPEKPIDSGNVGFKLLKSMGWTEGKGLGKESQGNIDPVATKLKTDRQGLASASEKTKKRPRTFKEEVLEKTKKRYEEKRN